MTFRQRLDRIMAAQDRNILSITDNYERDMLRVVSNANARAIYYLSNQLQTDRDGKVLSTAANRTVLRKLNRLFLDWMNESGFEIANARLIAQFGGYEPPSFVQVLDLINENIKNKLTFPKWMKADIQAFQGIKIATVDVLEGAVSIAAENAMRQALFAVGGLRFEDLTDLMGRSLDKTVAETRTLASTAVSTYYRTIHARGFERIQQENPELQLRYSYEGPIDKLTRPWCAKIARKSRSGRTYTRSEIDAFADDPERGKSQPPQPFYTGGGYNCRHQWILFIPEDRNAVKGRRKLPKP
mgnify:CR=1 FL=1